MRGMSTRPRGAIVNEDASSTRSAKGALGPAIDVFEVEPLPPKHAVPLLDNVVATPHIGYVSCDLYRVRRPVANIAGRLRRDPERRHLRGGQLGCAAKQKFAWVSTRRPAEGSLVAVLVAPEIREVDFEATHPTAHPLSFSNALV